MLYKVRMLLLSCLILNSMPVLASSLNVATSEWIPYVGKTLPNQGLAIDIVTTALQRAGYQPTVTIQSWSRTLEGTDVGVYDLIAAAWHSPEREAHFAFSKPYLHNEIKLIKKKDSSFEYTSVVDLNGKVIGMIPNYAYGEEFSQAQGVLRVPGSHILKNMLDVLNGRLELTLDDERVLQYELRHNMGTNRDKLVILPTPVSRKGLHIAVSKQNPKHREIVQAFDTAITAMKNDGTLERIVKLHATD